MAANSLKATLPSLQSTKVPREPVLITENEAKNFFSRASRGMIAATYPLFRCHCCDLSAAPPWEASDGPVMTRSLTTSVYADRGLEFCGLQVHYMMRQGIGRE